MGPFGLILCVIPMALSITISPNGNSPEIKMRRGMVMEMKKGPTVFEADTSLSSQKKVEKLIKLNNRELSINERYRRLIPYMTFYYANDLTQQTPKPEPVHNIEVEKAEIIEAQTLAPNNERQVKKIILSPHLNIPRYQGNRLTQHNIASSNPPKLYYKNTNLYRDDIRYPYHNTPSHVDFERIIHKPQRDPFGHFTPITRKPFIQINEDEEQYYLSEKVPKFKLVPYEQTPPVKVIRPHEHYQPLKNPIILHKEPTYTKNKQHPSQYYNEHPLHRAPLISTPRKPPAVVSESYYDNRRPQVQPFIEGGFQPIVQLVPLTTKAPLDMEYPYTEPEKSPIKVIEESTPRYDDNKYSTEQPKILYQFASNKLNLGDLINSLQVSHSIPKTITRENVGASIRTLLQVLNALKAEQNAVELDAPVLSSPKPFVVPAIDDEKYEGPSSPAPSPVTVADDLHEPYLANVNAPSQHLDDYPVEGGTRQQFPLPVTSDDEGGTPGTPGVDYPILTTIPQTSFDCKTQRYKGFFADPETRCQVWHYCDLNGGQASFLCPNGTIFSQAALTCDWWFNVKCASTTQLYVLNESLYKFILPHSPKFPEDYSGPLVDKYLTLKFKEMEEQFKKNKHKQTASERIDTTEESTEKETEDEATETTKGVSEASVVVETSGNTGTVQRLDDEK